MKFGKNPGIRWKTYKMLGFRLARYKSFWSVLRSQAQTFSGTFSGTTWPDSAPKPPGTFSGSFSGTLVNLTWLCTEASHTFSRNLCQNPVEPDLALHHWLCTKASQTFSGTFSGTSVECDLALQQSLPDLHRNLRNLLLNLTRRLHQCTPELFWAEDPISLRCWGKIGLWWLIIEIATVFQI